MFSIILSFFSFLDDIFWSYLAFLIILFLGTFLSFKTKFFQFRKFLSFCKNFYEFSQKKLSKKTKGIHPIKIFFVSSGGTIGIGNIIGIVSAICYGGPGALFWVWIAGILGSIVKYAEVYLGIKYRHSSEKGFSGGPMFFLEKAFKASWIPSLVAILLSIYSIEIYQFSIIVNSISTNWHIPQFLSLGILLVFVFYAVKGSLSRLSSICSLLLPFFILAYISMGFYIFIKEIRLIPEILSLVFKSAFTGHAAVGGFIGSSLIMTIRQGISRAAYSGDIGIGFDSVIQSEAAVVKPEFQAKLSIVSMALDNLICTISIIIVLLANTWSSGNEPSLVIQEALAKYFPLIKIFLPSLFFITGYTTITAYFIVGKKCAHYLLKEKGEKIYLYYGFFALSLFCFCPQNIPLLVMSLSGALLLIFNLSGIFKLRKQIYFPEKDSIENGLAP